jgi:hypothetical protein
MKFKKVEISIKASNSSDEYIKLYTDYDNGCLVESNNTPITFNVPEKLVNRIINSTHRLVETITGDEFEDEDVEDDEK